MKRGILLILMMILLVDLAEDGYLGNVKVGPLHTIVSTFLGNSPHYHFRQVESSHSLPSPDFRAIFGPQQPQPIKPRVQLALKLITTCNNSSSGGITR